MALPPIVAEIKAEAGKLYSELGKVRSEITKTGEEASKPFSKVQAAAGPALMAVGGFATAVGIKLTEMGDRGEAAHAQLKVAIENTGNAMSDFQGQINKTISHMANYGHTTDDVQSALTKMTAATNSPTKALSMMGEAADLAARQHESLSSAADQLDRILAGKGARTLALFGINMKTATTATKEHDMAVRQLTTTHDAYEKALTHEDELITIQAHKKKLTIADEIALKNAKDATLAAYLKWNEASTKEASTSAAMAAATRDNKDALGQLEEKLKGSAAASADTFGGKIAALKAHIENIAMSIGQQLGPAITAAGPLLMGFGAIISSGVIPAIISFGLRLATVAASSLAAFATMIIEAAAWAAATVVSVAIAMAPFLPLIAALAAIGIAAYELYQHWDQVWGFIKDIVNAAWTFIKQHIDLIIAVALGPLGIAIDLLKDHWQTVWDAIKTVVSTVWSALKTVFDAIVNTGLRVIGTEVKALQTIWNTAWSALGTVVHAAWTVIQGPLDLIRAAIQAIVDALHAIVGAASKAGSAISGALGGIGKAGGGILHALGLQYGGVVDGPTGAPRLTILHGGERVIPNGQMGRDDMANMGGTTNDHSVTVGEVHIHAGPGFSADDLLRQLRQLNGAA